MIAYYFTPGFFWFRVFGYGLLMRNIHVHPPLFSERNGYRKSVKLGKIWIRTLTKNGI